MSNRRPLSPEARKQILTMHRDGYTQLMIADRVGVHRHTVANVVARSAEPTPAELRQDVARLRAELEVRDRELETCRVVLAQLLMSSGPGSGAEPRHAPDSVDARRALSLATRPRPAPAEVAGRGLVAMTKWWRLERERQGCGHPLPMGGYHGWTEVQFGVWLAETRPEDLTLPGSSCP